MAGGRVEVEVIDALLDCVHLAVLTDLNRASVDKGYQRRRPSRYSWALLMNLIRRCTVIALLSLVLAPSLGADWPQWRGPDGTGISQDRAPVEWGPEANVAWRAELGGLGVSSPIVSGDRVVVTSQTGFVGLRAGGHPTLARGEVDGADRPLGEPPQEGDGQVQFLIETFDRATGRELWTRSIPARGPLQPVHPKHNLASSSPVTDGERIYAVFGTGQTAAFTMDGEEVWSRHLGEDYGPFGIVWGHASSPVVYRDLLILQCDHSSATHVEDASQASGAYLVALDTGTGEVRWKVDRGRDLFSYSTPVVVTGPAGDELIVNSSQRLDAYDPRTGEHLWHAGGPNEFPVTVATHASGVVYTSRGNFSGPYMKIRLGGRGDVTDTHVAWRVPTGAPYVSSLLYYQGLLYMANGRGIITSVDPETGETVWRERVGGAFTASPTAADGRVYFFSETGEAIVLAAGRRPLILARNDLATRILASPAMSAGQIFVRTDRHLVAIGD